MRYWTSNGPKRSLNQGRSLMTGREVRGSARWMKPWMRVCKCVWMIRLWQCWAAESLVWLYYHGTDGQSTWHTLTWQWKSVVYIGRIHTEDLETHIATTYNVVQTIRILLWLRHSLNFLLILLQGRNKRTRKGNSGLPHGSRSKLPCVWRPMSHFSRITTFF